MKETIEIVLLTVLCLVVVFGSFFYGILQTSENELRANIYSYEDCKARTNDVEWCFVKFQPDLEARKHLIKETNL